MKAIDLRKTQITDYIRVSSAAIWYDGSGIVPAHYEVETWILSDNTFIQKNAQCHHGSCYTSVIPEWLINKCAKVHDSMVKGLTKKHILNK